MEHSSQNNKAYTLGPWKANETKRVSGGGQIEIVHQTGDKNSEMVACIDTEWLCSVNIEDIDRNNAHLIASAPELLEACKKCHQLLFNGVKQDLVKELEQAIAKAEEGERE